MSSDNEPCTSEPAGDCLNQTLDDLYVEDYFEMMEQRLFLTSIFSRTRTIRMTSGTKPPEAAETVC